MHDFNDNARPNGFEAPDVDLPSEREDVALGRRRQAGLMVLAISRGYTPEDIADGYDDDVLEAFSDELELAEALVHVDALLGVLAPEVTV